MGQHARGYVGASGNRVVFSYSYSRQKLKRFARHAGQTRGWARYAIADGGGDTFHFTIKAP